MNFNLVCSSVLKIHYIIIFNLNNEFQNSNSQQKKKLLISISTKLIFFLEMFVNLMYCRQNNAF